MDLCRQISVLGVICPSRTRCSTAFLFLLLVGVFETGCDYDYSHYFSKSAEPASLQIGVLSAPTALDSFVKVKNYDFGQQPFGSSTTTTLYLVNQGELSGTDLTFSIDSSHYSFQTQCKTLAPSSAGGTSCPVDITFSPKTFDALPANLTYSYNNSKGTIVSTTIPLAAISMKWAFLTFVPSSQVLSLASVNQAQTFYLHVFYSGDLLKNQGQTTQNTIPPASWASSSALQVTTSSAKVTFPSTLAFTPSAVFSLDAAATAAYPTGCTSPITKSCDIGIRFNPSFAGTSSTAQSQADFLGQIGLHYFNGYSANAFTGTTFLAHGFSTANFAPYAMASSTTAGPLAYNPTQPQVINVPITNPNSSTVAGTNVSITLPSSPAFIQTAANLSASTCLNGGQIPTTGCSIQLTFNPQVPNIPANGSPISYTDSLKVTYYLGTSLKTLTSSLNGTAVTPAQVVFVDSNGNLVTNPTLDFGNIAAYYGSSKTFLIKNIGGVSTPLTYLNGSDTSFTFSGCNGNSLAANSTCTTSVTFTPKDVASLHTSSIQISYPSGSTSSVSVPITETLLGTGSANPLIIPQSGAYPVSTSVNGSAITYGASNLTVDLGAFMYGAAARSQTINLKIYGNRSIPAGLTTPSSVNGFSFSSPNCFTNIAAPTTAAATCNLTISYQPPANGAAPSALSQDVSLSYLDGSGSGGSVVLNLKAIPAPIPKLHFSQNPVTSPNSDPTGSYIFSDSAHPTYTGQLSSLSLYLYNDSPYFPVHLIAPTIQGSGSKFSVIQSSCASLLSANSSCKYDVKFTPVTTDSGTFTDNLQIKYTNEVTQAQVGYLTQGVSGYASTQIFPQQSPNPINLNFGTLYPGGSATATVNFSPIGYSTSPWWISLGSLPSKVAVQSNTCLTNSGSGIACSTVFSYSPANAGDAIPAGSSVNLTYQQNSSTQQVIPIGFTSNLQSTAATLNISQTNFGKIYNKSPDPLLPTSNFKTVVIKNSSSSPSGAIATFSSAALTSADGSFSLSPDASDPANCSANKTLAVGGGSCNIKVTFSPKTIGTITANLAITYFDQGQGKNVVQNSTLTGIGTVPIHIFAGGGVSCIIDETQQAVCWGENSYGQLGQGHTNRVNTLPQQMGKINFGAGVQVLKIAVSSEHVCAIVNTPNTQGAVTCWGGNDSGRLGLGLGTSGTFPSPLSAGSLNTVQLLDSNGAKAVATEISAGYGHICALFKDQTMSCWGVNSSYQLGNGTTQDIGATVSQMGANLPVVAVGGKVTSISAGTSHSCATLNDGTTKCWGGNGYGQLGLGINNLTIPAPTPVKVGSRPAAARVQTSSVGALTCILFSDKNLSCFGQSLYSDGNYNFYGTLGYCVARRNNDYSQPASLCWNSPTLTPTDKFGILASDVDQGLNTLPFSSGIAQLALGGQHGCVLFSSGSNGGCWGSNAYGQLGNGGTSNVGAGQNDLNTAFTPSFQPVPGHVPLEIATGAAHSCAVFTDNSVKCWGEGALDNANGLSKDTNQIADQLGATYDGTL